MIEITKKREYCKECGSLTYDREYRTICDYCRVEIPRSSKEMCELKGCYNNYDKEPERFHFCNIEHFFNFLSNAKIEKYDYLFLPLVYKKDFKLLQERLSK